MEDRLMRTRQLLGDENVARLRRSRVTVVGCGAVGSFAIEALSRAGIGHLKIIDFDQIALSNINRQLFALTSTLGRKKTDVASARIKDISADILVDAFDEKLTAENAARLLSETDFVIDAIDDVEGKTALIAYCKAQGLSFISSMGAARRMDLSKINVGRMDQTSGCPLAARLRKKLRAKGIPLDFPCVYSEEPAADAVAPGREMGSLVTVTGTFGLLLAHETVRRLLKL